MKYAAWSIFARKFNYQGVEFEIGKLEYVNKERDDRNANGRTK